MIKIGRRAVDVQLDEDLKKWSFIVLVALIKNFMNIGGKYSKKFDKKERFNGKGWFIIPMGTVLS